MRRDITHPEQAAFPTELPPEEAQAWACPLGAAGSTGDTREVVPGKF